MESESYHQLMFQKSKVRQALKHKKTGQILTGSLFDQKYNWILNGSKLSKRMWRHAGYPDITINNVIIGANQAEEDIKYLKLLDV